MQLIGNRGNADGGSLNRLALKFRIKLDGIHFKGIIIGNVMEIIINYNLRLRIGHCD